MGVQLNIKNAEAVELAHELAGITGESVTQAVLSALRDKRNALTKEERMVRIMALIEESGKLWGDGERNIDHTAFLYDDLGMPK
jgi:antitoxin VapB